MLIQPEIEGQEDGARKFVFQLISFVCALCTVGLFFWQLPWAKTAVIEIGSQQYHGMFLVLLAMGGSSFWKNILGYTKAVRDARRLGT